MPFGSFAGYQGGITSKTLSGLRLDSNWPIGDSSQQIQTFITLANTTNLSAQPQSVEATDFFSHQSDGHLLYGGKIVYRPDAFSASSIGGSYSVATAGTDDNEISSAIPIFGPLLVGTEIQLAHTSYYINLENDLGRILYSDSNMHMQLKLPSSAFGVIPFITSGSNVDQHLQLKYLHGDLYINDRWSLFARYEQVKTTNGRPTASVQQVLNSLNIESEYHKSLAGVRFDPTSNQAVLLQFSHHDTSRGRENNFHLSWTFVLDWGI